MGLPFGANRGFAADIPKTGTPTAFLKFLSAVTSGAQKERMKPAGGSYDCPPSSFSLLHLHRRQTAACLQLPSRPAGRLPQTGKCENRRWGGGCKQGGGEAADGEIFPEFSVAPFGQESGCEKCWWRCVVEKLCYNLGLPH